MPEPSCANQLYWTGYYGAFLGIQKPRNKEINAPLELSLIEALYLLENNRMTIVSGKEEITKEQLMDTAQKLIPRFKELYTVYKDLRERGFIVRRGLKFGVDYLVYKFGPGIDHAPYGVQVYGINDRIDPIDIVRMGRLLHSVKKKLIIAVVGKDSIDYILYSWWKP